nr:proteoglycan 4 isoform X4 [Odocoileus virginianus texanus]
MEWKILPIYSLLLFSVFSIQQVSSQELSCKGRCFESFARGRECDCDSDCKKYGKCCSDYDTFCEEVKDNKKKRTPKKKPTPEPPVIDEGGSGLDNGDFKLTPTPNIPTTQRNKVTTTPKITTVKPTLPKPSLPPKSDTTKETPSTVHTETTVETKETSTTNKQTSTSAKEKTTSAKETRTAENTSTKGLAPTPEVPATSTPKAETITKSPTPITPKEPAPTTPKEPAPTTPKEPAPTTPKEPAPTTTPKEPAPTPKEPVPTIIPKKPAPTIPKEPVPTTPKESAPVEPKEPTPNSPETSPPSSPDIPAPTTSEASTSTTTVEPPTTPKSPAESTPQPPIEPTPKALENSPKEPAVPTIKAPKVNKPEMTTTVKDKSTEKDIHSTPEITTAVAKIITEAATKTEKTTESKIPSTTTDATSTTTKDTTTSSKITPKATLAPKVMTTTKKTTKKTTSKPEQTTAVPKGTATNSQVTTPKPQKPTKAPKKPTSTKKPRTPRVRKPKTTPTPPKMTTSAMPEPTPTSLPEAMLQTTTSPTPTPNSEIIEVNPKNEDGDAAEGEKPHVIFRPPVLTPIVIPGTEIIVRGPSQGFGISPMFSDETNLCNGRPVDGLTTLRNGTLVAFRGHYFWMLSPFSPPSPPRRITEVWGIPSPIDTVFTRCNCEGKTFFFKGSQYWRFTNDIKDAGYPKLISKGFGGLSGKIVAALSIAQYKNRPESVYFFKRGGSVQQYTYKQEPTQKCTGRRPAINYSVYGETAQVRRRRFERAIGPSQIHTIRIHYSPIRVPYQDKGFLHNEVKVSTLWTGLPNVVTSAISLPNIRKPDGYDYYAFSKDQYYNIDVPSRTARAITARSGQTLSNSWYNCP